MLSCYCLRLRRSTQWNSALPLQVARFSRVDEALLYSEIHGVNNCLSAVTLLGTHRSVWAAVCSRLCVTMQAGPGSRVEDVFLYSKALMRQDAPVPQPERLSPINVAGMHPGSC